jgi:hypothetical protein
MVVLGVGCGGGPDVVAEEEGARGTGMEPRNPTQRTVAPCGRLVWLQVPAV